MGPHLCSQIKEAHLALTARASGLGVVGFRGVGDCFLVLGNCIVEFGLRAVQFIWFSSCQNHVLVDVTCNISFSKMTR